MKVRRFWHGYFEINMRVPSGPGIVTGVFSYAGQDGAERSHEIDIEILGRHTNMLEATIHENGKPTHKRIRLPFDAADGFPPGFDWQPDAIRWYADGKLIHEERGPVVARMRRPQISYRPVGHQGAQGMGRAAEPVEGAVETRHRLRRLRPTANKSLATKSVRAGHAKTHSPLARWWRGVITMFDRTQSFCDLAAARASMPPQPARFSDHQAEEQLHWAAWPTWRTRCFASGALPAGRRPTSRKPSQPWSPSKRRMITPCGRSTERPLRQAAVSSAIPRHSPRMAAGPITQRASRTPTATASNAAGGIEPAASRARQRLIGLTYS
jgi:hypothetical protein